jgi:hypothetical protein
MPPVLPPHRLLHRDLIIHGLMEVHHSPFRILPASNLCRSGGTKIAYILQDAAPASKARAEFRIVEATGGSPRQIADGPSSYPNLHDVVWHPSGKMIFAQGQTAEGTDGGNEH